MAERAVVKPSVLAALLGLGVLAACADDGAPTDVAVTAPSQTQTRSASTDAGASAVTSAGAQIQLSSCDTASNGRVYFKVGDSTLAIPAGAINEAVPANLRPPLQKEVVKRELQRQADGGAGCPGKPLDSALLFVKDDLGDPLLQGTVSFFRSGDGRLTERFAEFTRKLQTERPRNCKPLNGELLACVGTETRGEAQIPVMYVITTDTSQVMNTGGPLATRCVLEGERIKGCNLLDRLSGGVTFDATLNAGDYSTAKLRSAHAAALGKIETYRR